MDEHPNRERILVVAGIVVIGAFLAAIFSGGQTQQILSTVGAAVNVPATGSESRPAPTPAPTKGAATNGQVADAAAGPPTLLIVRTGTLELEVADLGAALRAGDAAVTRAGGYVSGSSQSASGETASADVTYRIPSTAWTPTLATLHGLATKMASEQIETEEVGGQVVDLAARLANLRATEAALQAIIARATRISDVLDVQEQLTTTRGEIERLVADKEHLEDQAAFASLAVTFRLPPTVTPTASPKPARGWDPGDDVARASERLVRIGQTTTSIGIWLAIIGLPIAIGGTVLALVAWQLWRLARWLIHRREAATPGGVSL